MTESYVEITRADRERVPVLATVLARTFADDPMIRWPFHDHHVVEGRAAVHGPAERVAALDIVLEADNGVGVAAWVPPGSEMGLEKVNVATGHAIAGLTDDDGDRYHRFWGWLESSLPTEPHWFLDMVGVEPSRQGEGIGGALVRHGIDLAQSDGVPAFLETGKARNVPYYERFGFRIAREDDAPGGGPHIWFMRLDP